jgi:hypothetical protein
VINPVSFDSIYINVFRPPKSSLARYPSQQMTSLMLLSSMPRKHSRHGRKFPSALVLDSCLSIRISSRFIRYVSYPKTENQLF